MAELRATISLDYAAFMQGLQVIVNAASKVGQTLQTNLTGGVDADMFAGVKQELKSLDPATDEFAQSLDGADKKAKKLRETGNGLGKAFNFNQITQAVTTLTSAVSTTLEPYKALDREIQNIGTISDLSLEKFTQLSTKVSTEIPATAAEVANGIYNAISAGLTGTEEELAGFVQTAGQVAVAGGSDVSSAVDGLTSVLNSYKLTAADADLVSQQFFGAIKLGKTTFGEINAAIANVVPTASAASVGFDEVAAGLAQMTALGVPTAQASTRMRAALIEMQKPTAGLKKVLDNAGLSVEELTRIISEEGMVEALNTVAVEAEKQGLSLTQAFSSSEAASAALLLAGDNVDTAREKLTALREEAENNVAGKAYEAAAKGIEVQSSIIINKVQALANQAFSAVGTSVTVALDAANQLAPTFTSFAALGDIIPTGKIKELGDGIRSSVLPAIKQIGVGVAQQGGIAATGMNVLRSAMGTVQVAARATWAAVTGPVGIAVALIAGLAATFVVLYNKVDGFREFVDNLWVTMKRLWEQLIPVFEQVGDLFLEVGGLLFEWLITPFEIAYTVISSVVGVIGDLINWLFSSTDAAESTGESFFDLSGAIDVVSAAIDFVIGTVRSFTNTLKTVKDSVGNFIDGLNPFSDKTLEEAWEEAGENLGNAVVSGFNEVEADKALEKLNDDIDANMQSIGNRVTDALKEGVGSQDAFQGLTDQLREDLKEQTSQIDAQIQYIENIEGLSSDYREGVLADLHSKRKEITDEGFALEQKIADDFHSRAKEAQEEADKQALSDRKKANEKALAEQKKFYQTLADLRDQASDSTFELNSTQVINDISALNAEIDELNRNEEIKESERQERTLALQNEIAEKKRQLEREQIEREATDRKAQFQKQLADIQANELLTKAQKIAAAEEIATLLQNLEAQKNLEVKAINDEFENERLNRSVEAQKKINKAKAAEELKGRRDQIALIDDIAEQELQTALLNEEERFKKELELAGENYALREKLAKDHVQRISQIELDAERKKDKLLDAAFRFRDALYTDFADSVIDANRSIGESLRDSLARTTEGIAEKLSKDADALISKYLEDVRAQTLTEEEEAEKRKAIYSDLGASAAAQMAQMVAQGESFGDAMAKVAVSALLKLIPVFTAHIFAKSSAEEGPIVGPILAATVTAALLALVSSATSGFKDGVVGLNGAGTETSDSIPARLSKGESVITAKGTKAQGNKSMLQYINDTGQSALGYFVNEYGELIKGIAREAVSVDLSSLQQTVNQLEVQAFAQPTLSPSLVGSMFVADRNDQAFERQTAELKAQLDAQTNALQSQKKRKHVVLKRDRKTKKTHREVYYA